MSALAASLFAIVGAACKLFFSCIFWSASWHKLRDLENFSTILLDYGFAESAPRKLLAGLVATTEFVLAALLLIPAFSALALQGMVLLLGVYVLALLNLYISGKALRDCGCGTRHQANRKLTMWPMARNCALILMMMLVLSSLGAVHSAYEWLMIVPISAVFLLAYWALEEMQSNRLIRIALREFRE